MADINVDQQGIKQLGQLTSDLEQMVPTASRKPIARRAQKEMTTVLRNALRPAQRELRAETPRDSGGLRRFAKLRVGRLRDGAIWCRVGWIDLIQSLRSIERRQERARARGREVSGSARSEQAVQRRRYIAANVLEGGSRGSSHGHPRVAQRIVERLQRRHETRVVNEFIVKYRQRLRVLMAEAVRRKSKITMR